MKIKQFWTVLLLLPVFFVSVCVAEAQGPTGSQQPAAVGEEEKFTYDLTWPDLFYTEETLEGSSEVNYDFYLPGSILPQPGSYLNLVFSHTTPQTDKQADLTVRLNDSLLEIIPLTAENADRGSVQLELPAALLQPSRNRIAAKLNTGLRCDETPTTRLITVIHTDSLIHLEYNLPRREPDLAIYPLPFYERTFLPSQVYFVLPANPTAVDLSTAAAISAGLGKYSDGQVKIATVLETELTDDIRLNYHLIVIGRPDANGLLAQLSFPLALDSQLIKEGSGVLQELVSPWNPAKMILVVTGRTDAGLLKAGDVLNRDLHFLGMRGPVAVVEEVLPPDQSLIQQTIDLTFDSLGYEDVPFYGVRSQVYRFYFRMPQSWEMTDKAKLFLSFNHSTAIDPLTSTLNVQLNDVPVGSTLLNGENAIDGILEVELPNWLIKSGRNRLDVNIGMAIAGDYCGNLDNPQAWTVIRRNSFVRLPYVVDKASFDLSFFPYPFAEDSNLTGVSLVIPEVLSRGQRDGLLQLAAVLGLQAGGERMTVRVLDAQDVSDDIIATHHLIVIGQPTVNALLRDLNGALPQPFQSNSDQLAPRLDSAVLTEVAVRNAGLLQEMTSPGNPDKVILVITGTTDEGVVAAYNLLLGNLPETAVGDPLTGNLAVIEDERIYSTDTRLLGPGALSERTTQVEPVAQIDTELRRALANRWW